MVVSLRITPLQIVLVSRRKKLKCRLFNSLNNSKKYITIMIMAVRTGSFQWCGVRLSVLRQDRSETKKNRSWTWSCRSGVVLWNTSLVTLVVVMILKDTATFQVLFTVSLYSLLGTSLLWRSTVAFIYLKVRSVKCLCLLPVVLVLLLWSWSWF